MIFKIKRFLKSLIRAFKYAKHGYNLQIVPPKSGNRVFIASANPPTNPDVLKRLSINIESINKE